MNVTPRLVTVQVIIVYSVLNLRNVLEMKHVIIINVVVHNLRIDNGAGTGKRLMVPIAFFIKLIAEMKMYRCDDWS